MNHLSFSNLKLLMACPRSWHSQYVEGIRLPSGAEAAFGQAFDQHVLTALGAEIKNTEPPVPLVPEALAQVQEAVQFYLLQPQAQAWKACHGQVPLRITPEEWEVWGEIYDIEARLPMPLIGYVDMLQPRVGGELCDLKTSGRKDFRPEWVLQLLIYALATRAPVAHLHLLTRLKRGFGFHAYRIRPVAASYRWMLATLSWWADRAMQVREMPKSRVPATPSWLCGYCVCALDCEGARLQVAEEY